MLKDKDQEALETYHDKYWKFPNRSCKECKEYPCMKGQNVLRSDFAKYGCKHYLQMIVYHCELLTYQRDCGDYIVYVFKNLDANGFLDKYIMCTKHPNWQSNPISIGDKGYLKVKEIVAGRDNWYNVDSKEMIPYKFDGVQFFDFVKEKHKDSEVIVL